MNASNSLPEDFVRCNGYDNLVCAIDSPPNETIQPNGSNCLAASNTLSEGLIHELPMMALSSNESKLIDTSNSSTTVTSKLNKSSDLKTMKSILEESNKGYNGIYAFL